MKHLKLRGVKRLAQGHTTMTTSVLIMVMKKWVELRWRAQRFPISLESVALEMLKITGLSNWNSQDCLIQVGEAPGQGPVCLLERGPANWTKSSLFGCITFIRTLPCSFIYELCFAVFVLQGQSWVTAIDAKAKNIYSWTFTENVCPLLLSRGVYSVSQNTQK